MDGPAAFGKLSNELCISIFEQLPHSALHHASQTCRRFHMLCIPILFHTIDLSIHNYEPRPKEYHPHLVERWPDNLREVIINQYLFINLLLRKQEYARLVRN